MTLGNIYSIIFFIFLYLPNALLLPFNLMLKGIAILKRRILHYISLFLWTSFSRSLASLVKVEKKSEMENFLVFGLFPLKYVNKNNNFFVFCLFLRHELRSYKNYHQSCYICTWFDSCLFWSNLAYFLQYVFKRVFLWCGTYCHY